MSRRGSPAGRRRLQDPVHPAPAQRPAARRSFEADTCGIPAARGPYRQVCRRADLPPYGVKHVIPAAAPAGTNPRRA